VEHDIAEVPAFSGCLSQGRTRDEALMNIREAIAGWIETMEAKRSVDPARTAEILV
jgi:predicted RNase H-like HicB family nuclease